MKTIGIDLWGGQVRGVPNNVTVARQVPRVAQYSVRELFMHTYARFAPLCRDVDEPGLALLAIHESTARAAGLVRLRARFDRYVAGIIGRHDECDLFLPANEDLALRHLAVVLDPVRSWSRNSNNIGFRVLDLRTSQGFRDEDDRPLRGLRAEGPAVMRCAGHVIIMLPLGDPTDWPERADDAWAMLPERVYFDELDGIPAGSMPRMMPPSRTQSVVMRTHGPRDTGMSLVECGEIAGMLELIGRDRRGEITVGAKALRDGVLLGRYARCDGAALLDDAKLSRVHALLLHVDDALIAIDTASRNGTRARGEANARVITLQSDTELELGTGTRARWHWAAS